MDYDKPIEMKPNCIGCHHIHPDNGNCTAVGGFCTAVPAAHCPLIPELRADLARVTAERDAAVEELENYMVQDVVEGNEPCGICAKASATPCECCDPKWRGIKEG